MAPASGASRAPRHVTASGIARAWRARSRPASVFGHGEESMLRSVGQIDVICLDYYFVSSNTTSGRL